MALILPYIALFFVFFLMANIDIWNVRLNQRSCRGLYIFALTLLILFAGCRWFDVPLVSASGTWQIFDYTSYEYVYDSPLSLCSFVVNYWNAESSIKSMDIGYVFVSSFFSQYIFTDANLFFLTISLVTVILFISGFKRNHIKNGLFLILFIFLTRLYFQYNFIMMRQSISMAIVWWALPFVVQKKFFKFLFFCVLGGVFHFTAFLFVIAYFLPNINLSNRYILYTILVFLILVILGITDRVFLFTIEKSVALIGLGEKAAAYIGSEAYRSGINPLNFLEMAPFLYFALKYRNVMYETSSGKLFFNMTVFYVFFMILTMNFIFLTRFSSYFMYAFFFVISTVFDRIKIYGNRVVYGYAFVVYFFIYGIRFIHANFSFTGYHLFFLN